MEDAENGTDQAGMQNSGTEEAPLSESRQDSPDLDGQKKAFDELNERYLRLAADFDNFRKRTAREQETIVSLANERIAVDILEVMDNLERALKEDDSHLREGIVHIQQMLTSLLERYSITPIDVRNKPFNPQEHEAIAHVPSPDGEGIIVEEISRGYRMHGKVIRYAKVAVSKGNQEA
jgi:molecular chaperone GrpE